MRRWIRVWACASALLLGGCLAAPIPHVACYTDELGYRSGAAARALNEGHVVAGSRDEVLRALGEPDVVTSDARGFGYVCQLQRGRWIGGAILPAPGGAVPIGLAVPFGDHVGLFVEFDEQGRVIRQEAAAVKMGAAMGMLYTLQTQEAESKAALGAWMDHRIGRDAKRGKAASTDPAPAPGGG